MTTPVNLFEGASIPLGSRLSLRELAPFAGRDAPNDAVLLKRQWSFRRDVMGGMLYWTGLGLAFELATRPTGAVILMYHSIAEDENARFVEPRMRMSPVMFERQMRFLASNRRVVPLSQMVRDISNGISPVPGTVCITFDDGYLDNLTVAAPILERYNLPATLYLATGYVERAEAQWADVLQWLFCFRTSDRLSVPSAGLQSSDLGTSAHRDSALSTLHKKLLGCSREERSRLLEEIRSQLLPRVEHPRLTMGWDDVRELRRRYPSFEIGGHTRDHIDLSGHGADVVRTQIAECANDLRRELSIEAGHFSFPYERWNPMAREAVISTGWHSAVGAGDAYRIVAGSDRYTMPRIEAPRSMTGLRFKTSGGYPGSLSLLGLR